MKLACTLKTYKIFTPSVWFSKYEFNNKLLSGVLLKVTLSIILNSNHIIYIYM